ncbi:hypothetical protein ANCCAN_06815 [Ancylostoma caninum]|uniref:Uncharacterized protein n=1 Tax=Ancylostoma caninum TaxID=29170 RepID=A0A368GRV1_ANCCA|nr:hypothetical protein ANCCAN_06815 [Ancylostoma caninum]
MSILFLLVGLVVIVSSQPPPPFGGGMGPPPPPPCGLPPFIDKLPADAQMKLKNIWGNYRQGTDCSNEHHQTRQILDSLPAEARSAIFRHGPHPPFVRVRFFCLLRITIEKFENGTDSIYVLHIFL